MSELAPWAFTKLKAFETCTRQGYSRYITREYPFTETEAMINGRNIHKMMEDRINDGTPFTPEFAWLEQFIPTPTDGNELAAEVELGITVEGEPCSFYENDCFFRGKLDVLNLEDDHCFIGDWKTGKPYEDPDELNIHAMLVKAHYPNIKHWRGFYVWLRTQKVGNIHVLSPARTLDKVRRRIDAVEELLATDPDRPKLNKLCPWCDLERCQHWTGKKGK